jgi:sarcosine oxidase gamma subunit
MNMSQDLIHQIARMLTGDPNVVVKAQVDDTVCPVSADQMDAEHVEQPCDDEAIVVMGQDTDEYGVPQQGGSCESQEEACEQEEDAANMDLSNADKIQMNGQKIAEILNSGCELDAWMQQKLTICRAYIGDILNALEFKNKHHNS